MYQHTKKYGFEYEIKITFGITLGQTLQNFKICQNFYFRRIALFKQLKMSKKSIFHKINLKCPKIRYIMHDQLLRYLA